MIPAPRPGIAATIARGVLEQAGVVEAHWGVLAERDVAAGPHRQRTAINKLRTLRVVAKSAGLSVEIDGPIAVLKGWQKTLGSLRDFDIAIEWLGRVRDAKDRRARDGAARLTEILREHRESERRRVTEARDGVAGNEAREALGRLRQWAACLVEGAAPPAPDEDAALEKAMLRRSAEEWFSRRDAAAARMTEENLHAFRRANKRIRDAAQFLAERGDTTWAPVQSCLQGAHRAMGNLNDLAVLQAIVATTWGDLARRGELGRNGTKEFTRLTEALDGMRRTEFGAFVDAWPALHGTALKERLRVGGRGA